MTDSTGTDAVWRGNVELHWRGDEFGDEGRALFAGDFEIGSVMLLKYDYVPGTLTRKPRERPWRSWVAANDYKNSACDWFATEKEAKAAVVDAAVKGLLKS